MEPGIEATACACELLYVYIYKLNLNPVGRHILTRRLSHRLLVLVTLITKSDQIGVNRTKSEIPSTK